MTQLNMAAVKLRQDGPINPSIEIADGQFLFRGVTEGGLVKEYFVSSASVREAATGIPVDSGWLEPNLVFGGVVRWGILRGQEWLILYLPPSVHNVELTEHDGTPGESVSRVAAPLPGMVLVGAAAQYFCFAVRTPKLDVHQELYRAPLPNVMQDGSICWGAQKPPMASGRTIADAWALFAYRTTFNNHAAGAKSKREPEDVRRVLRACAAEGSPYPVEDLRRQADEGGLTLDKAVRGLFDSGEMPG